MKTVTKVSVSSLKSRLKKLQVQRLLNSLVCFLKYEAITTNRLLSDLCHITAT